MGVWQPFWLLLAALSGAQIQQGPQNIQQNIGPPDAGTLFTGTGNNLYYGGFFSFLVLDNLLFPVNLVPFGPEVGDHEVNPGLLTAGQTIDLHMFFPFYGGLYNYTSVGHKV